MPAIQTPAGAGTAREPAGDDSVLYDSPAEFMRDAVSSGDECVAQSVIPTGDGTYAVGCSCGRWSTTATSMRDGLRLARRHTGSAP
jgi:hypothetical protein